MCNTYYRCHYTADYIPSRKIYSYKFRKLNNEIELISETPFKRGDIINILDIDYSENKIYIEVINDKNLDPNSYPILVIVGITIPFSLGLKPITESSGNHKVIFSTQTVYNNNQFYNCVISINRIPEIIRVDYVEEDNPDIVVYSAEWTIRKERNK